MKRERFRLRLCTEEEKEEFYRRNSLRKRKRIRYDEKEEDEEEYQDDDEQPGPSSHNPSNQRTQENSESLDPYNIFLIQFKKVHQSLFLTWKYTQYNIFCKNAESQLCAQHT